MHVGVHVYGICACICVWHMPVCTHTCICNMHVRTVLIKRGVNGARTGLEGGENGSARSIARSNGRVYRVGSAVVAFFQDLEC